jgi:hypothetical protein
VLPPCPEDLRRLFRVKSRHQLRSRIKECRRLKMVAVLRISPAQDEMPQDNTQLGPGEKGYSGGDHKEARAQATDFLKKRNKKGK